MIITRDSELPIHYFAYKNRPLKFNAGRIISERMFLESMYLEKIYLENIVSRKGALEKMS
jgi:hypothetical protein